MSTSLTQNGSSPGQNLALTVVSVPSSLDSGSSLDVNFPVRSFFSAVLLSSLELRDTKVYEP